MRIPLCSDLYDSILSMLSFFVCCRVHSLPLRSPPEPDPYPPPRAHAFLAGTPDVFVMLYRQESVDQDTPLSAFLPSLQDEGIFPLALLTRLSEEHNEIVRRSREVSRDICICSLLPPESASGHTAMLPSVYRVTCRLWCRYTRALCGVFFCFYWRKSARERDCAGKKLKIENQRAVVVLTSMCPKLELCGRYYSKVGIYSRSIAEARN